MARKPIHLQAAGKLTPRDRIWAAMRALKQFTYDDIADYVVKYAPAEARVRRLDEATIKSYVASLTRGGYVGRVVITPKRDRYEQALFNLVRDVGVYAPRVTKAGKPVTQGAGRLAMWRVMRKVKVFNRSSLAARASTEENVVDEEEAQTYIHYLAKAGYIVLVQPGNPHRQALYSFVRSRDSGPLAPMIQRVKHVYDPNLGVVVWHPEADA